MWLLLFLLLLFRWAFRFLFFLLALESTFCLVFSLLVSEAFFMCLEASVMLVLQFLLLLEVVALLLLLLLFVFLPLRCLQWLFLLLVGHLVLLFSEEVAFQLALGSELLCILIERYGLLLLLLALFQQAFLRFLFLFFS